MLSCWSNIRVNESLTIQLSSYHVFIIISEIRVYIFDIIVVIIKQEHHLGKILYIIFDIMIYLCGEHSRWSAPEKEDPFEIMDSLEDPIIFRVSPPPPMLLSGITHVEP
jgi:hypothetical protein